MGSGPKCCSKISRIRGRSDCYLFCLDVRWFSPNHPGNPRKCLSASTFLITEPATFISQFSCKSFINWDATGITCRSVSDDFCWCCFRMQQQQQLAAQLSHHHGSPRRSTEPPHSPTAASTTSDSSISLGAHSPPIPTSHTQSHTLPLALHRPFSPPRLTWYRPPHPPPGCWWQ